MQNLFAVAAILGVLATATTVSSVCCPVLTVDKQSNIDVVYDGNTLYYSCSGLAKYNKWTYVNGPELPSKGASTSFILDVAEITKTSEVKFTAMQAILRWTNNGKTATWNVWVGRFVAIGSSKILPGTGPHAVTIVTTSGGVSVIEDGAYVGTGKISIGPNVKVTYHIQALDVGATLKMTASNVFYSGGAKPAAIVA